jgi:hypothetical protein
MSVEQSRSIEERIIAIIRSFVGPHVLVTHDKLVGQDLGISGGDSVEFLDELEINFEIDLDKLVLQSTFHSEPSWIGRLLGKKEGRAVADLTVGELIRYIEATTATKLAAGRCGSRPDRRSG